MGRKRLFSRIAPAILSGVVLFLPVAGYVASATDELASANQFSRFSLLKPEGLSQFHLLRQHAYP